jgi:hypothetical protein
MLEYRHSLKEVILRELRGATAVKLASGVDVEAVTADLTERLQRLRQMRERTAREAC